MKEYIDQIRRIFTYMKKPNAPMDELVSLLQVTLNKITQSNDCLKIIQSRNGNDPFYIMVVPLKYDMIYDTKNVPTGYYIDLDLNAITRPSELGGISPEEATAWILHELAHNILTSTTRLRIQMLLAVNLNDSIRDKYSKVFKDDISSYFWCDIHSRTYKEFITPDGMTYEADKLLYNSGLQDDWNSAMNKYIEGCGGDAYRISEEHNDRLDLATLKMLNELMRENYTVRNVAYRGDIQMMHRIKQFISQNIQSNLIKQFLSINENNNNSLEMKEQNSFRILDDSLIKPASSHEVLTEAVELSDEQNRLSSLKYNDLLKKVDRIGFEMEDIRTIDDKVSIMYDIRDLMTTVEKRLKSEPTNELLLDELEKLQVMLDDLRKYKIPTRKYGLWIKGVPHGYEG